LGHGGGDGETTGGANFGGGRRSIVELVKRSYLAFFAGKIDSEVRDDLYKHFGATENVDFDQGSMPRQPGRILFPRKANASTYECGMLSSVFCIAPRGNAVWSPRLDEAIYHECIPVIMADNYEPPFSRILDYSSFSVRVPERNGGDLRAILSMISAAERSRLHSNLRKVKRLFRYTPWGTKPYGSDAAPLIAFELWLRKQGII
jgi:hypothetical protein